MKYKILQLQDIQKVKYAFMDYDFAKKHKFKLADYKVVYEGEVPLDLNNRKIKEVFLILDSLFTTFNVHRPKDFVGHSLSVSDLIQLDNDIYYVDSVGFQKVDA